MNKDAMDNPDCDDLGAQQQYPKMPVTLCGENRILQPDQPFVEHIGIKSAVNNPWISALLCRANTFVVPTLTS
jgi:hypothetical protein